MFKSILKELKIKFNQLKALVISNSLTNEQAQRRISELMFASNIVKSSLTKNETAFSAAQIEEINQFQAKIAEFKKEFSPFFIEDEVHDQFMEDVQDLPIRPGMDYFEENSISK